MSKDALSNLEMGYNSYRYFPNELHPSIIAMGERSCVRESQYACREGLEYVLVRSGRGNCVVNEERFPVERGSAALFMSFDFHKFVPDAGETLVLDFFRISSGTYLFMLASPYSAKVDADLSNYRFRTISFESPALEDIERLSDELLLMKSQNVQYDDAMMIYTFMEYVAKYDRQSSAARAKERAAQKESG